MYNICSLMHGMHSYEGFGDKRFGMLSHDADQREMPSSEKRLRDRKTILKRYLYADNARSINESTYQTNHFTKQFII